MWCYFQNDAAGSYSDVWSRIGSGVGIPAGYGAWERLELCVEVSVSIGKFDAKFDTLFRWKDSAIYFKIFFSSHWAR